MLLIIIRKLCPVNAVSAGGFAADEATF